VGMSLTVRTRKASAKRPMLTIAEPRRPPNRTSAPLPLADRRATPVVAANPRANTPSSPNPRSRRFTNGGRSTPGTFHTSAMASWQAWVIPSVPHMSATSPSATPTALPWSGSMLSPSWGPMIGKSLRADRMTASRRSRLRSITNPRMVVSSSSSGKTARNP
jgi:hypothetical protein